MDSMKLIRIKTHDAVSGAVTYECVGGTLPKAVGFKRNQPDIISVIIPTEEVYFDMGDRAQKVTPGVHVLMVEPSGRMTIMPQQQLEKNFTFTAVAD